MARWPILFHLRGVLFHGKANPYPTAGGVLTNFSPASGCTPAELYGSCSSDASPLPLLLAGPGHRPIVLVAPFLADSLPGTATPPQKVALVGDITGRGQIPGLLEVTNNIFHRTGNVTVLTNGDVLAAFQGLAADEVLLPVPGAVPATQVLETRRAMPIPHALVPAIMTHFNEGHLTWMWLWGTLGV